MTLKTTEPFSLPILTIVLPASLLSAAVSRIQIIDHASQVPPKYMRYRGSPYSSAPLISLSLSSQRFGRFPLRGTCLIKFYACTDLQKTSAYSFLRVEDQLSHLN